MVLLYTKKKLKLISLWSTPMNPSNSDPTATPSEDGVVSETPFNPEVAPSAEPSVETPTPQPAEASANPFFADNKTSEEGSTPVTPTAAPVAGPVVSQPEATPVAGAPVSASAPTPEGPKKSHKKIIVIASAAVGVVLLAIIGVVVFLLLTTVSKADYQAAATQYNQVSKASSALISDVKILGSSTGTTTDDRFESSLKDTQDSLAKIKTENESLAKLKAVRVGDGAKLYKTFDEKLDAYLVYGADLVTSVESIRPAMVVCGKVSDADDATSRISALKACATALGDAKDLPNSSFKTFVTELKDAYTSYASTYESMNKLTNPYGAQYEEYKTLRDEMYATQDKISAASKAFTASLNESDDKYSVKESANALGDYLTEQQR